MHTKKRGNTKRTQQEGVGVISLTSEIAEGMPLEADKTLLCVFSTRRSCSKELKIFSKMMDLGQTNLSFSQMRILSHDYLI